ncbi:PP2C family protein-serine/threonine phosphatase [Nevskia soli]|uniref:PP2C family protein-serine/threonine phosphatase n=1 Tax=Nevskia soli TaxID=418856 RepID=UPI0015D8203E|nr:PP2C family protein-serine/threonine phosphatase [Nevskia soli]
MRSLETLPVQLFSPIHSNHLNPRPELILLARVAEDLMHWLDCNWIVGLVRFGRDLQVACVMGERPNVQACIECVCDALRRSTSDRVLTLGERTQALPAIIARIGNVAGMEPLLAIGPRRAKGSYTERDMEMVRALCASVGVLLANPRLSEAMSAEVAETDRIRNEFETAQELQERFLPTVGPHVSGLEYHGRSQRCGCLGGDFFGFLHPNETELLMTLGKVAPVGAPAALLAAGLQATLRSRLENERDLGRIVRELNRMMWEVSPGDVFASLLCARIDPEQRRLEYVSAGQETAIVVRGRANRVDRLESSNAVLGLSLGSVYARHVVVFEPGDVLIAFTEGVADAAAPGNRPFLGAFPRMLGDVVNTTARDVASRVLDAVEMFSGRAAEDNDRTVTIIRSIGEAARGVRLESKSFAAAAA